MRTPRLEENKVVGRYKAKTPKSALAFYEAVKVTPGGVMAGIKFFEPYPVFMERAKGSRIWDIDGNEYVDFLMSYGALVLGHGSEVVDRATREVRRRFGTTVTGTPTSLEAEYGGDLRDAYHRGGMARFTNSGLEATLLAVRLARGYTGRRVVAKFEGHYHGAVDRLLFSYSPSTGHARSGAAPTPVPDSADVDEGILSDSLVLPFNDWEVTERLVTQNASRLGCVIMEPFEEGVIAAEKSFMKRLRRLTRDLKIPLIFDEVKTAFRVRLGGAGEYFSIVPDLTCLGKIIGGGHPLGAVVGDPEIMKLLDPTGNERRRVFHSGTFNGNPLSLWVGKATVEELRKGANFQSLCRWTVKLKEALSRELRARELEHQMQGEGAMFNIYFSPKPIRNYRDVARSNVRLRRLLDLELLVQGIYLKPGSRYCTSLAHSDTDLEETCKKFSDALDAIEPTRNN